MRDQYFVDCVCGLAVKAELYEAGTEKQCPSCQSLLRVPSSVKLREMSGDRTPFLSPLRKIRRAADHADSPFDGRCHFCHKSSADFQIPMTIHVMAERAVSGDDDDSWIYPRLLHFVILLIRTQKEEWEATNFPLLLCNSCFEQFQRSRMGSRIWHAAGAVLLLAVFWGLIWDTNYNENLIALLLPISWIICVFEFIRSILRGNRTSHSFLGQKRFSHYAAKYLREIPLVVEVIDTEDEYSLCIGKPTKYDPQASPSTK